MNASRGLSAEDFLTERWTFLLVTSSAMLEFEYTTIKIQNRLVEHLKRLANSPWCTVEKNECGSKNRHTSYLLKCTSTLIQTNSFHVYERCRMSGRNELMSSENRLLINQQVFSTPPLVNIIVQLQKLGILSTCQHSAFACNYDLHLCQSIFISNINKC